MNAVIQRTKDIVNIANAVNNLSIPLIRFKESFIRIVCKKLIMDAFS